MRNCRRALGCTGYGEAVLVGHALRHTAVRHLRKERDQTGCQGVEAAVEDVLWARAKPLTQKQEIHAAKRTGVRVGV